MLSFRTRQLLTALILATLLAGDVSAQSTWTEQAVRGAASITKRFVTVENLRAHYLETGSGPTVVMIHGNAGSIQDFEFAAIKILSSSYRVVAVDRPGHGGSDRPSRKATVEVQAELLHQTLSILRITEPLLVGHSWGGALALAYALKYPNEVSGLILLAPAAYPDESCCAPLATIERIPVIGDLSVAAGKLVAGRQMLRRGLVKAFYPQRLPNQYLKLVSSLWLGQRQLKSYIDDEASLNESLKIMSKHYSEICVPVVIVTGDQDQIVSPTQNAYALQRAIPQSRLIEIKNAGHEIPQTHPESIATALRMLSASTQE